MKIVSLLALAFGAAVQEYDDPLLNFLDRIDLDSYAYQQQSPLMASFDGAQILAPAQFSADDIEQYENGEGHWELQGYQMVQVPYYEMPDGSLLSEQEYEAVSEDYHLVPDEAYQEYQDRFGEERVPQVQQWAAARNFFGRVGRGLKNFGNRVKKGLQTAGRVLGKVASVALPIMKFIPGPIGLAARAIDMGINLGKGIHAAVQAGRKGGVGAAFRALGGHALNAATSMVPGGKFLNIGRGLLRGGGIAKGIAGFAKGFGGIAKIAKGFSKGRPALKRAVGFAKKAGGPVRAIARPPPSRKQSPPRPAPRRPAGRRR
jgi:hypothetical protein